MLSGGQRQRIAIGRAIVKKPNIFLFDEPLSNLDAQLRNHMRMEIRKLHKRLNAISIYVTHDQTEAMTLADKLVVLNQGSIEQIGSPQEIFENPNSLFVAKFIGTSPLNQLTTDNTILQQCSLSADVHTLAIRSEDVMYCKPCESDFIQLDNGELEEQEILGTDSLYHYDFSGLSITIKAPTQQALNSEQTLYLPWNKIMLFNKEGKRSAYQQSPLLQKSNSVSAA